MQSIELSHVTLRYPGRISPALCDITLAIDRGEKVALVGPSGAGKSSLLSILAGFTGISEGEIYLNGRTRAECDALHVTWIGQRPYLFPSTLAENIALGRPEATRQEIEAAASAARLMDFAAALPLGLDTVIGERGLGLSGGEAQRVALARAFLDNAPLLVLDEPTAHLDADTEAALIETIAALAQGKTLVLATHSASLLALCERVLPLDEGRLAAGSPPDAPRRMPPRGIPTYSYARPTPIHVVSVGDGVVRPHVGMPLGGIRRGGIRRGGIRRGGIRRGGIRRGASSGEHPAFMHEMLQYLALIRGKLLGRFLLGLFLACLASLAAVGLLGLSGWFITTSALVGLLGITTFSFLFPSAGVRAFALLRTVARYGERVVNHQATFDFLARLRVLSFARASHLPLQSITRYRSGDLLARMMADIDMLDQMLVRILVPTLSTAIVVICALIFLGGYSVLLAACAGIAVIAGGAALPLLMARLGRRPGAQFVEARAEARTRFVEALEGRREIASYQAERIVNQQVGQALTLAEGVQRAQLRHASFSAALMSALTSVTLLCTLLIGLSLVTGRVLDGAIVVMLYLVITAVFECIEGLPQAYQFLGQTRHAARRLNTLLPAVGPAPVQPEKTAHTWQEAIRIERLSFRYDAQRVPVFQNLTCVFPAGSLMAITGPSGAGKTTLLKLLARELEPDQGTIVLGETPLERIQAEEMYRHLVLVSQDSHIFNASLRENLLMARPDATEQEMRSVLEAVCLTRLVEKLTDGLDTMLGEHGEMLSGGERRRLSLAQALLKTPSILLLDEPTSGVDYETAQSILATLRTRLPLSTIVVATHEAWLRWLADHHLVLPPS